MALGSALLGQAVLAAFAVLSADATWSGTSVNDLHEEYYNIFKTRNRNAASHLWSKFLLDRSQDMTAENLVHMFSGFCPVSGSPVDPQYRTRYKVSLDKVGGGKKTGYVYHCCSPCICDTQDFIKVDTRTVTTKGGAQQQYHFAVIGNPCKNQEELTKPYEDAFGRGMTTLSEQAPELSCDASGNLEGAYVSDGGNIIISMFFEVDPSKQSMDEADFADYCAQRAQAGYASGMGKIFRKVAAIAPVDLAPQPSTAAATSNIGQSPPTKSGMSSKVAGNTTLLNHVKGANGTAHSSSPKKPNENEGGSATSGAAANEGLGSGEVSFASIAAKVNLVLVAGGFALMCSRFSHLWTSLCNTQ